MNVTASLANLVRKVRTPLTLAGFCLLVLYLVLKQVLSLPAFKTALNGAAVYALLDKIITYMFVTSIIALVGGLGSYVLSQILPRPRTSKLIVGKAIIVHEQDRKTDTT
jgi:hypothetical protein